MNKKIYFCLVYILLTRIVYSDTTSLYYSLAQDIIVNVKNEERLNKIILDSSKKNGIIVSKPFQITQLKNQSITVYKVKGCSGFHMLMKISILHGRINKDWKLNFNKGMISINEYIKDDNDIIIYKFPVTLLGEIGTLEASILKSASIWSKDMTTKRLFLNMKMEDNYISFKVDKNDRVNFDKFLVSLIMKKNNFSIYDYGYRIILSHNHTPGHKPM